MITKEVNLWLGTENKRVRVPVSQYDTMWSFVFTVINGSVEWTIPTGATASLNGAKPDGNVFAFAGTIANNRVTVGADVQMTAVAGDTICELSFSHDGKVIGTANFVLVVEEAPKQDGAVISDSNVDAYGAIIEGSIAEYLDAHPELITDGQLWNVQQVALLRQVLSHLKYDSAAAGAIAEELLESLEANPEPQGWTKPEIDLLDELLSHVKYTDEQGGAYADALINALNGVIVEEVTA